MMKHWLKRGKSGTDAGAGSLKSKKSELELPSTRGRMCANETSSIVSDMEQPPSHKPPTLYQNSKSSDEKNAQAAKLKNRKVTITDANDFKESHKVTMTFPDKEMPEDQLKLLSLYFDTIPECASLVKRKILISSEQYFRLAVESYEQLRAVHYRASLNFTLAEWLHIHALLLYGRIQQVQLSLDRKNDVPQHNKIDLSGDIKVFSPIATALASIGGVEDYEHGYLFVPDAVLPERRSPGAGYSATEIQQILNGTLYDWQRSWNRVLDSRIERESRESNQKMTRSASELIVAISETASSIDRIRRRQQEIPEGDERDEYVIQLASKQRNLSELYKEALDAKDYTIQSPVYAQSDNKFFSSEPTLNVRPQRSSTILGKDKMPPPRAATPIEATVPLRTSSRTAATGSPQSYSSQETFCVSIGTAPDSVIAKYNQHYPRTKMFNIDNSHHTKTPMQQYQQQGKVTPLGSPRVSQSKRFPVELPVTGFSEAKDSNSVRRLGSLRQQHNETSQSEVQTPQQGPYKTPESMKTNRQRTATSQLKRAPQVPPLSLPYNDALRSTVQSPVIPPADFHTSKSQFDTYLEGIFSDSEVSLMTPPDTSVDSDNTSLMANDEKNFEVKQQTTTFDNKEPLSATSNHNGKFFDAVDSEPTALDEDETKSFMTADDSDSLHPSMTVSLDHSPIQDTPEVMHSPLFQNRKFEPNSPTLNRRSSTKKGTRKVVIGGSSDSLDQFVHYDAQLWADYTTFVNKIQESKLAKFDAIPTATAGNLAWLLPVKVNKTVQRDITVKLPYKSVSKQEQALALILQTCYLYQDPVGSWHNEVRTKVDLGTFVSKYVATAVDDRTL